jgi:cytochrome c biogenesis protein CcmG, thiol:disulfide interchange protein DsbE
MKRIVVFLVPLFAFLLLAVFLYRGLFLNPREVPSPLIGKPAPQFELPKLGAEVPSRARTCRAGVGFNVWASWCTPCRVEHPLFNQLANRTSSRSSA